MSSTQRARVQVIMDADDFAHLWHTAQEWARYADGADGGWRRHVLGGRFEAGGTASAHPSLAWQWAYWVGRDYASVILARAFLAAWGEECETAWDCADEGGWVILTNYAQADET